MSFTILEDTPPSRIWNSHRPYQIVFLFVFLHELVNNSRRILIPETNKTIREGHHNQSKKSYELHPTASEVSKTTLVIIYGEYRTFDMTCAGIFEHLVKPNMPAMVLLAVHDPTSMTPYGSAQGCMKDRGV